MIKSSRYPDIFLTEAPYIALIEAEEMNVAFNYWILQSIKVVYHRCEIRTVNVPDIVGYIKVK
ncbi:MAG: hypothetical protein O9264_01085 [Leptospira sp.]|nr:hypothetical protein [Leptospira sp.]